MAGKERDTGYMPNPTHRHMIARLNQRDQVFLPISLLSKSLCKLGNVGVAFIGGSLNPRPCKRAAYRLALD